jgi:hypothetical protein
VALDGRSLVPLLTGAGDWPHRTLCVHSQRIDYPEKWRHCAVMTERGRLVDGKELYDIAADPGQKNDVADENPAVVAELRAQYETWWADISKRFDESVRIELGAEKANPVQLTCHDWHAPIAEVPWNQEQIRRDPAANGFWAVDVLRLGRYEVTLRSRPASAAAPLKAKRARVLVGDAKSESAVSAGADAVTLAIDLAAGPQKLETRLEGKDGPTRGAYFVEVRRIE